VPSCPRLHEAQRRCQAASWRLHERRSHLVCLLLCVARRFDALQDTAIFDVLLPPYDDRAGRSCHYYAAEERADGEGGRCSELVEVGWPPNLHVVSREYLGPRVSRGGGGGR